MKNTKSKALTGMMHTHPTNAKRKLTEHEWQEGNRTGVFSDKYRDKKGQEIWNKRYPK